MIKHQLNVPDFKTMYIFKVISVPTENQFYLLGKLCNEMFVIHDFKKAFITWFFDWNETQTHFTFTRSFCSMNAVHFSRSLFQQTLQRKWPRWCPSLGIYCRNKVWATKRRSHLFSGGGTVFFVDWNIIKTNNRQKLFKLESQEM